MPKKLRYIYFLFVAAIRNEDMGELCVWTLSDLIPSSCLAKPIELKDDGCTIVTANHGHTFHFGYKHMWDCRYENRWRCWFKYDPDPFEDSDSDEVEDSDSGDGEGMDHYWCMVDTFQFYIVRVFCFFNSLNFIAFFHIFGYCCGTRAFALLERFSVGRTEGF